MTGLENFDCRGYAVRLDGGQGCADGFDGLNEGSNIGLWQVGLRKI